MAKHKEKVSSYPYPSRYGTHKSMVLDTQVASNGQTYAKCADEYGEYITPLSNVDSGLSDPNRTSQKRLSKLFSGKKE